MKLSGSLDLVISVNTDEVSLNKELDFSVFLGSFGNNYIEHINVIFPLQHDTEITFTGITSLGEPFRQYICFEGPIKTMVHDINYLDLQSNKLIKNLTSYTRILSKSLLLPHHTDTFLVNSNKCYDQYLFNMETRASLYMELASKELSPLDSNF
jgi:hypothetical protein